MQPQEVLREETYIKSDHKDPEEPFSDSFVQLVAEHFRIPENKSCETCKYRTRDQHIVEVRYEEVRIMVLIIRCSHRKHNPCYPADNEVRDERERPQHRCCKTDPAFIHRKEPVKDFNPGRNRNRHRCNREERVNGRTVPHCEEVVGPYKETQDGNGDN